MSGVDLYDWLKALHVAVAMTFVGGVIATTIFLSVQGQVADTSQAAAIWRRWDGRLTTPAMVLVWALGLTLGLWAGWFKSGWLPTKLVFVLLLSGVHGVQSGMLRRRAGGRTVPFAAAPMLAAVLGSVLIIAAMAVVKPF